MNLCCLIYQQASSLNVYYYKLILPNRNWLETSSNEAMYNLHQLGWYSFQQLAITVAKEIFGQTISSFLPSKDGGRDGSFTGKWKKNELESMDGQYVFQCKFTNKVERRLTISDLEGEMIKIEKLVNQGICDFYILFTNYGVSGNSESTISKEVQKIGVKYFKIYDRDWIIQTIKENSRLRIMVPRVYGLGDLSQIIDHRVYEQAKELLSSLKDEFAKMVITNSYRRAEKALREHGFVLLIGGPASGKTTIASNLAIGAMDLWKSPTMKLQTADEVVTHWDPNDPGQFFWIDDAFGVTRYESNLTRRWNHVMLQVKAMVKQNVKVVMTSRDYIYDEARKDLKVSSFPLLDESKVVIDVHELSGDEKRQMLYNHIKMGDQPLEFRRGIKPFLESISNLKEFLPETARRLGSKFHTKGLFINEYYVRDFVIKQEDFFIELLRSLDKDLIAVLALIYMNNDRLQSPLELNDDELRSIERLDSSVGGCGKALRAMKNNLVQFVATTEGSYWKYKHPTIGDAFSEFIKEDPELIEIYLRGCGVEKLLAQVSCGKHIRNTIIIPSKFYNLVLDRIVNFNSSNNYRDEWIAQWGAKRELLDFLANRCSRQFLESYINVKPDIFQIISHTSEYIEISVEVDLACKLHSFKLLPEEVRLKLVEMISSYAKDGKNLWVFRLDKVKSLFHKNELKKLRSDVINNLVPALSVLREQKENSYDESGDAERHMDSFLEVLEIIEDEFSGTQDIGFSVRHEIKMVRDWITANEKRDEIETRRKLTDEGVEYGITNERSIFDDVDVP